MVQVDVKNFHYIIQNVSQDDALAKYLFDTGKIMVLDRQWRLKGGEIANKFDLVKRNISLWQWLNLRGVFRTLRNI